MVWTPVHHSWIPNTCKHAHRAGCTAWGTKGCRVRPPQEEVNAVTKLSFCAVSWASHQGFSLLLLVCYTHRVYLGSIRVWKLPLRSHRFIVPKIMSTYCWYVTTWTNCWQGWDHPQGLGASGQQLNSGTLSPVSVVIWWPLFFFFPYEAF